MLATFKHGRRYNIRASSPAGRHRRGGQDAAELARQSAAVERRESISLPPRRYYELLLDLLPWCRTYVGRHPETGEALSAVLVARHAGRAYHLFAGRSGVQPELMANDLAWWAAIKAALRPAAVTTTSGGAAARSGPAPVARPSFFKAEFGGEEVLCGGGARSVVGCCAAADLEQRARRHSGPETQHLLTILQIS
jgi:hypothetical protein